MISPKVAEKLLGYLNNVYPGGIQSFTEKGGDVTLLQESIIVSFPEENLVLRRNIGTQFYGTPFLFFSKPFNTDQQLFADIQNELIDLLMEDGVGTYAHGVSIALRSCYILIQSMHTLPKTMVAKINKMIKKYEVPRTLFFQPNESIEVWEKEIEPEPEAKPAQTHKGEVVISTEQITNLKIDLSKEQDVMDFLKSLES